MLWADWLQRMAQVIAFIKIVRLLVVRLLLKVWWTGLHTRSSRSKRRITTTTDLILRFQPTSRQTECLKNKWVAAHPQYLRRQKAGQLLLNNKRLASQAKIRFAVSSSSIGFKSDLISYNNEIQNFNFSPCPNCDWSIFTIVEFHRRRWIRADGLFGWARQSSLLTQVLTLELLLLIHSERYDRIQYLWNLKEQ